MSGVVLISRHTKFNHVLFVEILNEIEERDKEEEIIPKQYGVL